MAIHIVENTNAGDTLINTIKNYMQTKINLVLIWSTSKSTQNIEKKFLNSVEMSNLNTYNEEFFFFFLNACMGIQKNIPYRKQYFYCSFEQLFIFFSSSFIFKCTYLFGACF